MRAIVPLVATLSLFSGCVGALREPPMLAGEEDPGGTGAVQRSVRYARPPVVARRKTLTLKDCLECALSSHRSLRMAERRVLILRGALAAETRVLVKLNVERKNLEAVTAKLPSLHAPTVNSLGVEGWFSVESVVEEHTVRSIIPELKAAGAEGIIELSLNKIVQ